MALLTFDGVNIHYDPVTFSLTASERTHTVISPLGSHAVQTLGNNARVLSCSGRYPRADGAFLYNRLRPLVGKRARALVCETDSFSAILTEISVTGDTEVGVRVKLTFTESLPAEVTADAY